MISDHQGKVYYKQTIIHTNILTCSSSPAVTHSPSITSSPGKSYPVAPSAAPPIPALSQPVQLTTQVFDIYENADTSSLAGINTANVETSVFPSNPAQSSNSITYSKEVQTNDSWLQSQTQPESETDVDTLRASIRAEIEEEYRLRDAHFQETQEDGATTLLYEKETNKSTPVQNVNTDAPKFSFQDIEVQIPNASEGSSGSNTVTDSLESDSLSKFMSQSLKVVNRAMDTSFYDITVDYADVNDSGSAKQTGLNGMNTPLVQISQFYSNTGSKGRAVTDIDWHSKFPELLASAHTEKRGDPHAPKGIIQIWNLHSSSLDSTPEYLFKSPSDVLSAKFSLFSPTIVFGTCYNGQVLTWDFRAGADPVLSSPLNGTGHSHPVYALELTGTQHAQNVLTASTDGAVCTWTPDILESPQDKLVLSGPTAAAASAAAAAALSSSGYGTNNTSLPFLSSSHRNDEIAPTQLAISHRDPSRFVVGTEEGIIYQCSKFGGAGSRAGIDPRGAYRSHCAPVTCLSFHSSKGATDLSDLLLSGGLDWAIKLWRVRPFNGPLGGSTSHNPSSTNPSTFSENSSNSFLLSNSGSSLSTHGNNLLPLLDISREYEVYDVAWSNSHPSVFGSVDGSGHLEIWDLLKDTEAPISRVRPTIYTDRSATNTGPNSGNSALPLGSNRNGADKYGNNGRRDEHNENILSAEDYLSRPLNKLAWSRPVSAFHSNQQLNNSAFSDLPTSSINNGSSVDPSSAPNPTSTKNEYSNAFGAKNRVAVGGLDGVVTVYELDNEIFPAPNPQDWRQMEKMLSNVDNF